MGIERSFCLKCQSPDEFFDSWPDTIMYLYKPESAQKNLYIWSEPGVIALLNLGWNLGFVALVVPVLKRNLHFYYVL
jgi:hypothetical protein